MLIYKIVTQAQWQAAEPERRFHGAPVDHADGYIHFSTAEQVQETADKYFTGQHDLLLVTVSSDALGAALRFEPSRGGALFPHLYAALDFNTVRSVEPLPLNPDGRPLVEALLV